MNRCRCLFAALLPLAALAGCAGPQVRAHIDSVNAEYRQLEDYVYCLEDENAKLQRELNRLRGGDAPPRPFSRSSSPAADESSSDSSDLSPPVIEPGTPVPPPGTSGSRSSTQRPNLPASSSNADGKLDLVPPIIELPSSNQEAGPATDSLPTPAIPRERPAAPEAIPLPPADSKVTHIHLNPLLTGGADFDRQPGDEGLSIVLEPRNAADQYVPQAGAVSVVVLDPSKAGDAARIARWDFTLTAAQQKLQTTSAAKGLHLEMPWPASAPSSNQLQLFVRYETADGRRLQTDREIYITPPGQIAQRWTPRSASSPPLPLGEGRGEGAAVSHLAPSIAPLPSIVSKIEPAPASPNAEPEAAVAAPEKLTAPKWSPDR